MNNDSGTRTVNSIDQTQDAQLLVASLYAELEAAESRATAAKAHEQQLADWIKSDGVSKELFNAVIKRAEDAERQLAAVTRDAKKYRWLRGYCTDYSFLCEQGLCGEAMDDAIDAAMIKAGWKNNGKS